LSILLHVAFLAEKHDPFDLHPHDVAVTEKLQRILGTFPNQPSMSHMLDYVCVSGNDPTAADSSPS
jgi:hypothetical protein